MAAHVAKPSSEQTNDAMAMPFVFATGAYTYALTLRIGRTLLSLRGRDPAAFDLARNGDALLLSRLGQAAKL